MAKRYDLVIVGLGSGGMSAATFAARLGRRVAVVERARVGGDCLWTGCVPSKALLASAKVAHHLRNPGHWGLPGDGAWPQESGERALDTGPVFERIRAVQGQIAAAEDNAARFEAEGVEVLQGTASLAGPHRVLVRSDDGVERVLRTRYVLLCTGSRPATALDGADAAGCLTSENMFELPAAPASLVVVGGGPIAVELAQALCRLGVEVTILQRGNRLLPRDEPELVAQLTACLEAEGVRIHTRVEATRVVLEPDGTRTVVGTGPNGPATWSAAQVLVAAGRQPNLEGLDLEAAGVETNARGVVVDDRLRSTLRSVYAAGDVAGRHLFTHAAGYEAVLAVRNMLFPFDAKADATVPWCTFTDPELAHAGMTETEAIARHGAASVTVHRQDLSHNDRARSDGAGAGALVIITGPKERIVGAHLLAPGAGEAIQELSLAMRQGLRLSDLAGLVHVYPTVATGIGQLAADAAYARAHRMRWLLRLAR